MNLQQTFFGFCVLIMGTASANAALIEVIAKGDGSYYDYSTSTYVYSGAQVTATFLFDTADAPLVSSNTNNTYGLYQAANTDWISATLSVNGGTEVFDEGDFSSDDSVSDYVRMYDQNTTGNYGFEQQFVYSFGYDYNYNGGLTTNDYFYTYAYFNEYYDDILSGIGLNQIYSWTDNDSSDSGYGYARFYSYNNNTTSYDTNGYLNYNLTSMSARYIEANAPKSALLLLLATGILVAFRKYNLMR